MFNNFNVSIVEKLPTTLLEIYVYRHSLEGTHILKSDFNTVELVPEGSEIKPTLLLNRYIFDLMVKAGVESGIKKEDESTTKGKLEATSYHLEDLRKLLKLK